MRSFATSISSMKIVKVGWAVHAQADQKPILGKKLAPVFIEENSIGLKGIADDLPWGSVTFLQFDNFLEEIEARKGGLASLPSVDGLPQPEG